MELNKLEMPICRCFWLFYVYDRSINLHKSGFTQFKRIERRKKYEYGYKSYLLNAIAHKRGCYSFYL